MFNTASNTNCRTLEIAKSLKPLPVLFNPMIPIVLFFEGVIPNTVHQVAQNLLYRNLNSHNKGQGGTGYIYIYFKKASTFPQFDFSVNHAFGQQCTVCPRTRTKLETSKQGCG